MDGFDVKRVAAKQPSRKRVVDLGFDRTGAVKGFAEADQAGICVDADPKHIGEFFRAKSFDRNDLHGRRPPIGLGPRVTAAVARGLLFVDATAFSTATDRRLTPLVIYHNMF
jgi:hypothetical protein